MKEEQFLEQAIAMARENVRNDGRPFAALIVKGDTIVATAVNRMNADNDPTAHAELLALRAAGAELGTTKLSGCTVYASGQPCPMCMAAMRIAGISRIVYAYSNTDGASFGLSTSGIAADLSRPVETQDWASIRQIPPRDHEKPELYLAWQAHSRARE